MISRLAGLLFARHGCLIFLGGYFLLLLALRITLFHGSSEDDAEQLFFSQAVSWGYKVNQPPLYTWLVILLQKAVGVSEASVAIVKYSALFAIYYFIYRAAEEIFDDTVYAALSTLSLLAIFYINWDAVVNYSHTVLMAAFLAATLFAVLRLPARNGILSYVVLGALLGLGLLSKYNFALFLVPLAIAAAASKNLRAHLFTPKILISLAVAAVLIAPHAAWLLGSPGSIKTTPEYMDVAGGAGSAIVRTAKGVLDAAAGAVLFLSPLWLLYLVFFRRAFAPLTGRVSDGFLSDSRIADHSAGAEADRRFFEIYFLAFGALAVLGIAAFTLAGIRNHWMIPLLPFSLYMMLRIRAVSPRRAVLERFAVLLAVFAFAVVIALTVRALTAPNFCKKCNFFFPYAGLAEQIKTAGFDRGTILVNDLPNQLGGNLRRYFPESRIISRRYAYFTPVLKRDGGKCLLVWNESPWAHKNTRAVVVALAERKLGLSIPAGLPSRYLEAPLPRSKNRTAKLGYLILPDCG
ncbi:MAG: glycosyltransferase family 39 protein [Rhodospirillales bacterium]